MEVVPLNLTLSHFHQKGNSEKEQPPFHRLSLEDYMEQEQNFAHTPCYRCVILGTITFSLLSAFVAYLVGKGITLLRNGGKLA